MGLFLCPNGGDTNGLPQSFLCVTITSELGFLAKHPTTGAAIQSPYVAIANTYMTQANRLWAEIFQIVRENCTSEYAGSNPHDDVMERLLRARKG